jgi:hypothetical protein
MIVSIEYYDHGCAISDKSDALNKEEGNSPRTRRCIAELVSKSSLGNWEGGNRQ